MPSPVALRARREAAPLVLAGALPLIFLHREYQPHLSVGAVDAYLSDFAVLAIVVVAAMSIRRLRVAERAPLAAWTAFAALVFVGTVWGALRFGAYPAGTHGVTAAKWFEYMLLAPAVVLIVRRSDDLLPAAAVLVAWSVTATIVGAVQFFGLIGNLDHTHGGHRVPSFLGDHDFAALSGAAVVLAFVIASRGPASRSERWFATAAGTGAVGMVLAGAFDAILGLVLATAAILIVSRTRTRRRSALVLAVLAAIVLGALAVRSQAVADGLKFLGVKGGGTGGAASHIQSYRQRTLLAYIGLRIFVGHPGLGVGWEGSSDEYAYGPYVGAARRLFDQPPEAFPSPAHPWGVQNAYVQALSDLGVLGLPLFLLALLVPAWIAVRRGVGDRRTAGVALVLLTVGCWNGVGLVAGIPITALTWLVAGVAASAPQGDRETAPDR